MNKKILMLLNAPYPTDIRVRKEASALISAGFELTMLCLRKEDEKREEIQDGIRIHRIDAGKKNYQLAFWDVIMSLIFIHPKFKAAAKKILDQEKISAIHVHDLPLVGTALALKKRQQDLKVVYDMHENYPEALPLWFAWKKGIIVRLKNSLFMNTPRWLKWEKIALDQSDHILTVVDEMKENIQKKYKINSSKISVVSNTESPEFLNSPLDESIYQSFKGKFILAYVGGLGPHRGVDTAVEGMSRLQDKNTILVIVGGGSTDAIDELKKQINTLNLSNQVFLMGHQPFSKVYSFMKMANVNVIPHQKNIQNDNGVPHKLFQSMMTAKPVLVSSCNSLQRIITETNSGLVFDAGNGQDFARKVAQLSVDHHLSEKLGENALKASTKGKYSWEETAVVLIGVYKHLFEDN